MTDRELLEKAARAAGMRCIEYTNDYDGAMGLMQCDAQGRHTYTWNPLHDDGDALRLAVKLGLLVYVMSAAAFTAVRLPGEHIGGKYDEVQNHGSDPYSATRRAIVRAAAAIADSTDAKE